MCVDASEAGWTMDESIVCLPGFSHSWSYQLLCNPWNWQLLANLSTFRGSDSLSMRRDCNQGSGDSRKISSSCWKSAALVFPPFKLEHHHYIIYLWALTDLLFFLHMLILIVVFLLISLEPNTFQRPSRFALFGVSSARNRSYKC